MYSENNDKKKVKILLTGASFYTGNLGVSALAESAIKCIKNRWPHSEIIFISEGRTSYKYSVRINKEDIIIKNIPFKYSKNIFQRDHYFRYFTHALFYKIISRKLFLKFFKIRNPYIKDILEADLVADITGGDSFSDIYGMKRFILGISIKLLSILYEKPVILLPQTYGPFKKVISKIISKYLIKKSVAVYSRDKAGVEYLKTILSAQDFNNKVKFIPDVAFCLDPKKPEGDQIKIYTRNKNKNIFVGLNVSGLLFHGGYTQNNMFNLNIDYRDFIIQIINYFLSIENVNVILIPHVFPEEKLAVESDLIACNYIYEKLHPVSGNRILFQNTEFNHSEIKYVIGLTDFFLGSRMHSCIAAISQNIPTVGLAYSKKFRGVFESVNMDKYVIDLFAKRNDEILYSISTAFRKRHKTAKHLKKTIPKIKENVLNMLNNFDLSS